MSTENEQSQESIDQEIEKILQQRAREAESREETPADPPPTQTQTQTPVPQTGAQAVRVITETTKVADAIIQQVEEFAKDTPEAKALLKAYRGQIQEAAATAVDQGFNAESILDQTDWVKNTKDKIVGDLVTSGQSRTFKGEVEEAPSGNGVSVNSSLAALKRTYGEDKVEGALKKLKPLIDAGAKITDDELKKVLRAPQ